MRRSVRTRVHVFGPNGRIRTKTDKVAGEEPPELEEKFRRRESIPQRISLMILGYDF
ncbi:hypothetical protein [Brevibacterium paucivorans]|uniref:hypothetical protein n=1 Tax=Brevibacterium paucivorans TaxID=170994 RepID=UPI0031DDE307